MFNPSTILTASTILAGSIITPFVSHILGRKKRSAPSPLYHAGSKVIKIGTMQAKWFVNGKLFYRDYLELPQLVVGNIGEHVVINSKNSSHGDYTIKLIDAWHQYRQFQGYYHYVSHPGFYGKITIKHVDSINQVIRGVWQGHSHQGTNVSGTFEWVWGNAKSKKFRTSRKGSNGVTIV